MIYSDIEDDLDKPWYPDDSGEWIETNGKDFSHLVGDNEFNYLHISERDHCRNQYTDLPYLYSEFDKYKIQKICAIKIVRQ